MKKQGKLKKTEKNPLMSPTPSSEISIIPAYDRFYNFDYLREHYEWQCWGLVIRHLRGYANMDQDIFGRLLCGYTRSQISRYETEAAEPPIDFWVKMMKAFGVSINWACTGKGLPYVEEYQESEERLRFYKWAQLMVEKEDFLQELKGWGQS